MEGILPLELGGGVGAGGGERMRGVHVVKPIVFGTVSSLLAKKRESDGHTHEWKVHVKPYASNEDMSSYIKKVQFKLHESYGEKANRIVSKPPYQINESGWGEFEIQIRIFFNDGNERPVTFYHILKLFHGANTPANAPAIPVDVTRGGSSISTQIIQGRKCVVSESYDEILFTEPTPFMHTLLTNTRKLYSGGGHTKHDSNLEERKQLSLTAIRDGRTKVQEEIAEFRAKLQLAKDTITQFKGEIGKVQPFLEPLPVDD